MVDPLVLLALGVLVNELGGGEYRLNLGLGPFPRGEAELISDVIPAVLPVIAREAVDREPLWVFWVELDGQGTVALAMARTRAENGVLPLRLPFRILAADCGSITCLVPCVRERCG